MRVIKKVIILNDYKKITYLKIENKKREKSYIHIEFGCIKKKELFI